MNSRPQGLSAVSLPKAFFTPAATNRVASVDLRREGPNPSKGLWEFSFAEVGNFIGYSRNLSSGYRHRCPLNEALGQSVAGMPNVLRFCFFLKFQIFMGYFVF